MATVIYVLSDPNSGEVRYVGKTVQRRIRKRLDQHMWDSRRNTRRVSNWIKSLNGAWPIMRSLIIVENDMGSDVEIAVISLYRKLGYRLTNLTSGGEGVLGLRISESHREKLRQAGKRRGAVKVTPEGRARTIAANVGRKASPSTLKKLRESHLLIGPKKVRGKGLKTGQVTPEGRASQVAAMMGNMFAVRKHSKEEVVRRAVSLRRRLAMKRGDLIVGPNWEAQPPNRNDRRRLLQEQKQGAVPHLSARNT